MGRHIFQTLLEDKNKSVLLLLFTELNYTIGLSFENTFDEKYTSNRAGSPMFQHCFLQPIMVNGGYFHQNGKNSCLEPIDLPSYSTKILKLSLIHISEPTRPY